MKKVLLIISLLILSVCLFGCSSEPLEFTLDQKEYTIPQASSSVTITGTLRGDGSPNIYLDDKKLYFIPRKDKTFSYVYSIPKVEKRIPEKTLRFVAKTREEEVVQEVTIINEHAAKYAADKAPLEAMVGTTVADAKAKILELGYTPTYYQDQAKSDITVKQITSPEEEPAAWIIVSVRSVDIDKKTVQLNVNTAEGIAENEATAAAAKALNEKLDSYRAWVATENYGKAQYPFGFELYYFRSREVPLDENTWLLKGPATVYNVYGEKIKMTCEAKVTGTTHDPRVIEFTVY